MDKTILITRPNHDLPTKYLYFWCQPVIKTARKSKLKLIDLSKKKANYKNFLKSVGQSNFVFFNGHGSKTMITGFDNEPLIEADNNENLLKDKLIYGRSCQAGAVLGKSLVKAKALVFIGYKQDFFLCYSRSKIKKPLKDKLAGLFLQPSNLIPQTIIKGQTSSQSYQNSQGAMKKNLSFMLSSKATKTQKDAAPYLWSNINCQVLIGDNKAKL
ncbi:hypothetical protein COT75_03635 [Candidatus Beckwithbacteria bacterium CG10_big_fil_rev_8_21_14_0_10_34_10]|uniref:Gingipain domain-containing protein n=1 Tax=Candidatus Beckwithbacteria bacterium CG10_big_fil_rev_8_21_14_0_10_34_10 TaxID=1974495 RepID=A0A2H0W8P1_9BACT|nr:MAG: hypothetical protein COT75_03635 [Candidatus Beckwithbacteria bacterium CG10_big_fil_rev_8_21_14_0_10_34_10]